MRHYLVAIALLPAVGLPILAGQLATERLAEASTASRIERDLAAVQALDRLRSAVSTEVTAGSLTLIAAQLGLSVPMLGAQVGLPTGTVAATRAATSQALAEVPPLPAVATRLSGAAQQLRALRASMDSALASRELADLATTSMGYSRLGDQVSDAERYVARLIASGGEGTTSRRLLASARALEAITPVVINGGKRAGLFYVHLLAPATAQAQIGDQLMTATQAYRIRSADLGPDLTPQLARTWARMAADDQMRSFDAAVSGGQSPSLRQGGTTAGQGLDLAGLMAILPVAQAGAHVLTQLGTLLEQAVAEAATAARADAAEARQRTIASLIVAAGILVITAIALFIIGGMLRNRLHQLAIGAKRLSAGHLDPVQVQGPRELASTSEAINDAVASLRHVEAKAALLASGDLHSPELERPAPGPLGAAVDASVARIVTAVREREELQVQLAHQASHDALTGLPNRAELDHALAAALSAAQRAGSRVWVLFIDLDRFKACNDRLGHAAGDHVLREVADRLRSTVRAGDVVGRLGGDEFVVIVATADTGSDVAELGERLVAVLSQPMRYQGQPVQVGASIGISGGRGGQVTPDQLLSEADTASYRAKRAGGSKVEAHDQAMRERAGATRGLST